MTMPTGISITNLLNDDDSPTVVSSRSRGAGGRTARSRAELTSNFQRIVLKTKVDQVPDSSSPIPPGLGHPVLLPNNLDGVNQKRPRPQTAHQQAVNENRKARVEHILHNKLEDEHGRRRKKRKHGEHYLIKAARRISELPDLYDTEDEGSWGPGGLVPNPGEEEDYGEDALYKHKILNRALRRTNRWDDGDAENRTVKKGRGHNKADVDDEAQGFPKRRKRSSTPVADDEGADNEELDDLELELLGESRGRGMKKQPRQEVGDDHDRQEEDVESSGEDSGSDDNESDDDDESEEGGDEMDVAGRINELLDD